MKFTRRHMWIVAAVLVVAIAAYVVALPAYNAAHVAGAQ